MTAPRPAAGGAGPRRYDSRFSFLTAAMAWAMILVIVIPGNLDYTGQSQESVDGNPVTRGLWLVILAIGVAVVLIRMTLALRVLRQVNVFYLIFLALAAASAVWSIDSELTVRKLLRMLITCSAFLAIAVAAWHPRRFQQVVRPVMTFIVIGSIVFALARPDIALHHEPFPELIDAWHGLCLTKNQLGSVASFAFILWAHAWLAKETGRLAAFIGASTAAACLVLSRSETSIMATLLTVLAMVLLMRTPGSMRRSIPFLASALIAVILLYSMAMLKVVPGLDIILAPIPMITGKDLTFSHRAEIWAVVMDHVRLRPLLGSGYGAYWVPGMPTPNIESYAVLGPLNGLYPGSSHNGYLQILNDLGAAGLICLLGYVVTFFRQSIRLYSIDRTQGALFFGLLLQQTTINLSEPIWLNVLMVDFIPLSIATTCLARALVDAQDRPISRTPVVAAHRAVGPSAPAEQRPPGLRRLVRPPPPSRTNQP